MMFSQNPIVFIVCVIGLAFVATMIWLGFYLIRHRPYFAKPGDAEHAVVYANTVRRHPTPDDGSQQHPPVYCADHVAFPPPSYEAVSTRDAVPTPHEVHVLRRRLEKLNCHRGRRRSSSSPADASAACETAIRDSQIRDLSQRTDQWEMLRDDEEQDDGHAPALSRRRTVSVVQPGHEPTTRPTILGPEAGEAMLQRSATEPGLVHCTRWRNVAPPPTPTAAASSPTPGDMDIRIAVLREQLMRAASNRYSAEI
ncbi:hypothetical protein MY11210_006091 [Beauveria gryllotalpidicola]